MSLRRRNKENEKKKEFAAGGVSGFAGPRLLYFNQKGEGFTAAAEIGSFYTFIIEYTFLYYSVFHRVFINITIYVF